MKRVNTQIKNENVIASVVIGGVFLITGLLTWLVAYYS